MVISLSPIPSPMSSMALRAFPPWMACLAAEVLSVCDPDAVTDVRLERTLTRDLNQS